jgi:hypothetical protein
MSSSYNTNYNNNTAASEASDDLQSSSVLEQNLLFEDKEILNNYKDENGNPVVPSYVNGSKIWFWDRTSEQWVLQHAVVLGNETIKQGPQGEVGASAYQSYLNTTEDFPPMSEADWVNSLSGIDGADGIDGIDGNNGSDGSDGSDGSGSQGPQGDPGDAICAETPTAPTTGERGKLWIDSINQIIVTLG